MPENIAIVLLCLLGFLIVSMKPNPLGPGGCYQVHQLQGPGVLLIS